MSRFVALFPKAWPEGDKVTLVWWSSMDHQCRVLYRAIPVESLEDVADLPPSRGDATTFFWVYDLEKNQRIVSHQGEKAALEDGWTIGELTTAMTTPSNWSPPGTPLGKLYRRRQ